MTVHIVRFSITLLFNILFIWNIAYIAVKCKNFTRKSAIGILYMICCVAVCGFCELNWIPYFMYPLYALVSGIISIWLCAKYKNWSSKEFIHIK